MDLRACSMRYAVQIHNFNIVEDFLKLDSTLYLIKNNIDTKESY